MAKRLFDKQAFSKIECNRCGQCCTNFRPNNDYWKSLHDGPLGILEAYGRYETWNMSMNMIYEDNFKTMLWYGQLTPVLEEWEGQKQHYRCGHYEQDIDGEGVCIIYEDRPAMCSNFPYGPEQWNEARKNGEQTIVDEGYDKCSWQVRWLDFKVIEG